MMKTFTLTPARRFLCAAALCLAAGAGTTLAQPAAPGATTQLSRHDEHFVAKAAKLGSTEVRLSQLAATRASRPEVREYAQQLVTDHLKANSDLAQLASTKGLILPQEDKLNLERWSKKKGTAFDKDYLKEMIDAHTDAIELLEKSASQAEDTDIAAYARTHLPALQEHLRKAKELHKMID